MEKDAMLRAGRMAALLAALFAVPAFADSTSSSGS